MRRWDILRLGHTQIKPIIIKHTWLKVERAMIFLKSRPLSTNSLVMMSVSVVIDVKTDKLMGLRDGWN